MSSSGPSADNECQAVIIPQIRLICQHNRGYKRIYLLFYWYSGVGLWVCLIVTYQCATKRGDGNLGIDAAG